MRIPSTHLRLLLAVVFLIVVGRVSAQNISTSGMVPGHMKKPPVDVTRVQLFTSGTVLEVRPNVPYSGTSTPLASFLTGNASTTTGTGGTIFGLQTVPTFVGAFA